MILHLLDPILTTLIFIDMIQLSNVVFPENHCFEFRAIQLPRQSTLVWAKKFELELVTFELASTRKKEGEIGFSHYGFLQDHPFGHGTHTVDCTYSRCNGGTFRPDVSLASNRLLATHRRPDRPNLELQIMIRITQLHP